MRFTLRAEARRGRCPIPTLGRLSVHNALAAAAAGRAAGLSLDEIAAGLRAAWSAPHRGPGRSSGRGDRPRRQLQRLAPVGGRRARPACRLARPARRGPRRDARAGRGAATRATGASARPRPGRPTGWSSSAPVPARIAEARPRPGLAERDIVRGAATRDALDAPRRACATATSSWSRPPAGSPSSALVDALWA